jgi:hypothetical protein
MSYFEVILANVCFALFVSLLFVAHVSTKRDAARIAEIEALRRVAFRTK